MGRAKGIALFVSLVILVLLTLLAVTGLRMSIVEERVSGNQKLAAGSLFAAEQGISEGIEDLMLGTITVSADIGWTATGSVDGTGYSADYTIRHFLSADGSKVEDDDGRTYLRINSTGQSDNGSGRRMVEVVAALEQGGEGNVAGLIGCQGVTGLSNVQTSSYSSSGEPSTNERGDIATTDPGALLYLVGSSDFDVHGEVRSTGRLYIDSDTLIRRDALANDGIWMKSGVIGGIARTNGSFIDDGGTVVGAIEQGPSVTPNPVVALDPCDPWDIVSIFENADDIMTANDNGELGIASGSSYSRGTSSIGVFGQARDYYFSTFQLDSDAILTVNGDVRIYARDYFWMKSNAQLILAADASLKIYVERNYFWMDSNTRANHDPYNDSPCDPGGCPIDLQVFVKAENTAKSPSGDPWKYDDWDKGACYDASKDCWASVIIDSNSVFYGIIYAPLAHVVLNSNADVSGSARGRYVTGDSNLTFHYDEDLDDLYSGLPSAYQIVYWSEQYPEN
jgi:hypothetical protein